MHISVFNILQAQCTDNAKRWRGKWGTVLPPLCFVQLLLPDIVVSFYFGVCIVRLFCFTRPALRLLSVFLLLLQLLLLLPPALFAVGCCRVLFVSCRLHGTSHTFMSIGARPFPFHFRYCKTFRIKYIFLCFVRMPRCDCFISMPLLLCCCCCCCSWWFLHFAKVVCCHYFWYFMRPLPLLHLFPLWHRQA